ncbi:MAG: hypothetical protein E1N59_379 [Puniceicoccaceae bacterium 5H]|nr:MAG: hypothetical protein E1N59_379 [Puniceicoccaceae bacterium 5H]
MTKSQLLQNHRRGSVYVLILIMSAAFGMLVYSMLSLQSSELKNNYSYTLQKQARLANESLFFLVCEQLKDIYDNNTASLQPGSSVTITIPKEQLEAMLPASLHASFKYESDGVEVVVGSLSDWTLRFVGSDVPGSENSQFLNQKHSYRSVPVLTKVTLIGSNGAKAVNCARSVFAVKAAPLTSYAIFYNQLLESYAGGDFTAAGRVHVNGDFSTANNASNAFHLYFDRVTVTGKHFMDDFHGNSDSRIIAFTNGLTRADGSPYFVALENRSNSKSILNNLYTVSAFNPGAFDFGELQGRSESGYPYRSWMDNHFSEVGDSHWYDLALENWNGYLKTGVHGVQKVTVPGMERYEVPEGSSFTPTSEDYWNTSYQMIQPVREADSEDFAVDNADHAANLTREHNKFAYNAGLIIEVDGHSGYDGYGYVDLDPATVSFKAYTYKRDAKGDVVYNGDGTPQTVDVGDPVALGIVKLNRYSEDPYDNSLVTSGMYDNRRREHVNLVEVDVGKIKEIVDDYNDLDSTERFTQDPVGGDLNNGFWNGSVYVQFPYASKSRIWEGDDKPTHDGIQRSVGNYGLYVHNGQELPEQGLTIATNNVVYLSGHYNADGDPTTGDMQTPDDADEPPAAIAADSVILLSSAWESDESWRYSKKGYSDRKAAATEYSTALITGNVPTGRQTSTGTSSNSGSIANFLRFYESWQNNSSRMWDSHSEGIEALVRGSIVCMWDSEVAEERWPGHSNVYYRPARLFGYNKLFDSRVPPGIPLGGFSGPGYFSEIKQSEWDDAVAEVRPTTPTEA